ncbi:MAG: hypothetical protein IPO21_01035 [Bacteroidales bacterium]|nr:hypothetical protein [Bacteroidales bacterium]
MKLLLNKFKSFLFLIKPKRIVAVSRAFNCEEWVEISIKSVIDHVDAVLIVRSDKAYLNANIEYEDIEPIIDKLKQKYGEKIVVLRKNWNNEDEQFPDLIKYVKNEMKATHFMMLDTDEVYKREDIKELIALTKKIKTFNKALYVDMYTYIKSIYYRVAPMEPYKPLSIFPLVDYLKVSSFRHIEGVPRFNTGIPMHHFALVRKKDERIKAKFATRNTYTRVENWYEKFYENFSPEIKDFHPIIGQHSQWKSIEIVKNIDLPDGVQDEFKSWIV